ncbi:MAG: DUF2723 domain-containing protein [bacterium]|nr:DUF2723 domain-containing protein [bacterium]
MVIFLIVFLIIVYFLHPAQSIGDGAEFLTCGITLGITHPPGFPMYIILLKLFETIIPFGNPAYKMAVLNALSVALAFYLINKIEKVFLTLFFILTTSFILFNVSIHEVFPVLILFSFLGLYTIKFPATCGFVSGLAASIHQYYVFLLPYIFFRLRNKILIFLITFLAGLTPHFIIPIRSISGTPQNVGDPSDLNKFLRYVLRKDYGTFKLKVEEKQSYNTEVIIKQILRPFKHFYEENKFFVFVAIFSFIYAVYKKYFPYYIYLFILTGILFLLVGNSDFSIETEGVLKRFYILPFIFLVLFVALTIKKEYVFIFLILINIPSLLKIHTRWNFLSYDYGTSITRLLKENSYFFMDGGDDTFYTSMYNVYGLKKRSVSLHDRGAVVFKNIYGADFRRLTKEQKRVRRIEVETRLIKEGNYLSYSTMDENVIPIKLYKNYFLYSNYEIKYADEFTLIRDKFNRNILYDYRHRALLPYFFFMKDNYQAYLYAYMIAKDVEWLKNNLAIKLGELSAKALESKKMEDAFKYLKLGEKINPNDYVILSNLGVYYESVNDYENAVFYHIRAYEVSKNIRSLLNLAATYWKMGNYSMAKDIYKRILSIEPNNLEARYWLSVLEKKRF